MRKQFYEIALFVSILTIATWIVLALLERIWPIADPFIEYRIAYRNRALDVVTVSIGLYGTCGDRVSFHVADVNGRPPVPIGLTAIDLDGETIEVRRGKERWDVINGGRDFTVTYDLTLTDEDRYTPEVNDMLTVLYADRCRIMGRDVFIIPECRISRGVFIDMRVNERRTARSAWRSNRDRIIVPVLEELPMTIAVSGSYRYVTTTVGTAEVTLAIAGNWSFSDRELFELICGIVRREISLFDSSPHDSYFFVCDRNPVRNHGTFDNFGVHFARNMLLLFDPRLDRSDLFDTPMSIIAHEFFHNWNGDAIRPASDEFLWFTEGATVYYSYRILLDVHVIVPSQYESRRAAIARRYHENPYRPDVALASAVNSNLSDQDMVNLLYDGGFFAAEALDRRLAEITGGGVHLIDVLRDLYHNDSSRDGIDENILCDAIRRVSGSDLSSFIEELVKEPSPEVLEESASPSPAPVSRLNDHEPVHPRRPVSS
jgi:predicted metalloprotease with PDZ domain